MCVEEVIKERPVMRHVAEQNWKGEQHRIAALFITLAYIDSDDLM
jgi:hypothetical protein